jgi:hypothetical protein
MSEPSTHEVTVLLLAWNQGDQKALARLTPLVYQELRRLARGYLGASAPATRCKPRHW